MAIRIWQDDYSSGIDFIDRQHMELFHLLNTFEENNDVSVGSDVLTGFLEKMTAHCEEHFEAENKVMKERNYPLFDYHKKNHDGFIEKVKTFLQQHKNGKLKEPYYQTIDLGIELLHHVVRNDLTVFSYFKNRGYSINQDMVEKSCEITTLENKFINYGKISSISDECVIIDCNLENKILVLHDLVKVSVMIGTLDCNYFIAEVFEQQEKSLSLFKNTLIKTVNDRKHFRVVANLDGKLRDENGEPWHVMIIDISSGGILAETEAALSLNEEAMVEFMIHNIRFKKRCRVVRLFKKDTVLHHYGMQFVEEGASVHQRLAKSLSTLQVRLHRPKPLRLIRPKEEGNEG